MRDLLHFILSRLAFLGDAYFKAIGEGIYSIGYLGQQI